MRLTAVTIATNEEAHIARALRSVQGLADEIIVVDGGSTDGTVEVARTFTDKVFANPWPGYGKQKNFALDRATGDWVLFVDADEEVTPELADEMRRVISPNTYHLTPNTYFVRIITVFLGKPLRHLWGTNPRLLRRGAVRWDDREIHEQVVRADNSTVRLDDPEVALLSSPLLHPSHYDTLAAYKEKRARYTTRDAEEMLKTGHDRLGRPVGPIPNFPLPISKFLYGRALKQFIRLTFKKRGFLDGWQGCLWIFLSVQYEIMVAKKYLALSRERQMSNAK